MFAAKSYSCRPFTLFYFPLFDVDKSGPCKPDLDEDIDPATGKPRLHWAELPPEEGEAWPTRVARYALRGSFKALAGLPRGIHVAV